MVSGGPYGLEDVFGGAGYTRALLLLLLVPIFWSLPTALMVGELASALPSEGGFYQWVRRALGPFWGFQEAWLSLAASVFDMALYPTLFALYLARIAPSLNLGHRALALKLLIVVLAALWNLRGAVSVGNGSLRLAALSLAPFAVLIGIVLSRLATTPTFTPATGAAPPHLDLSAALLVTLWNYMGWDNASTIAGEVRRPQRTYPHAMLGATLAVTAVYTLPLLAVWAAGIPSQTFSTGAWVDVARHLGGPVLALSVVLAGAIVGLGTYNALVLSYSRLPAALAHDRLLPAAFARLTPRGVPWVSVLALSLCWALALSLPFDRLITLDLVLYGASLLLEFVALLVLRRREPDLPRPFRIPGRLPIAALTALGPTLLIAWALFAARREHVGPLPALAFALLIAALGPILYLVAIKRAPTPSAGPQL